MSKCFNLVEAKAAFLCGYFHVHVDENIQSPKNPMEMLFLGVGHDDNVINIYNNPHCQNDCIRFANLVLHPKKKLILCQTDSTLHLTAMTLYLARFI